MPKAARRTSAPRAEPYPTGKTSAPKSTTKKPLAEKSAAENNVAVEKAILPPKSTAKKENKPKTSSHVEPPTSSFLDIKLDDEDECGDVPVYDTCATIRHKINALLGKDNQKPENLNPTETTKDGTRKPFNKASFVRVLNKDGNECSTRSLDTFLKAKRMMGGAESAIYPAAYKFFEKKRVFEGKKKSAARLKVEADRPYGLPFRDPNKMWLIVGPGERASDFLDEYGQ